jgi:hypothetical protein
MYYKSEQAVFSQKSGMYIFRPAKTGSQPDEYGDLISKQYYKGRRFEVIRVHSKYHFPISVGSHVITSIWKTPLENTFDVESFLESVPIHTFGKEVVMRVYTGIKNSETFFTDSNGLEL